MHWTREVFVDVVLHSGFLAVELTLMLYLLGERIILSHPVTKLYGYGASASPDLRPAIALSLVVAGLCLGLAVMVCKRAREPWLDHVVESAGMTVGVAAMHLLFIKLIALEYIPS